MPQKALCAGSVEEPGEGHLLPSPWLRTKDHVSGEDGLASVTASVHFSKFNLPRSSVNGLSTVLRQLPYHS